MTTPSAPPHIQVGRTSFSVDGKEVVITLTRTDGELITVRIPVSRLERWAMRTLRDEAFA
jgi:hypothetical protein